MKFSQAILFTVASSAALVAAVPSVASSGAVPAVKAGGQATRAASKAVKPAQGIAGKQQLPKGSASGSQTIRRTRLGTEEPGAHHRAAGSQNTKARVGSVVAPKSHKLKGQSGQGHPTNSRGHPHHSKQRQGGVRPHEHEGSEHPVNPSLKGHSASNAARKQGGTHPHANTNQQATPIHSAQSAIRKQPALNARDVIDQLELYVRALEEELDARDYFEDELDARDFEDDLSARDVDVDIELLVRNFEDELAARGLSLSYDQLEIRGNGQHHCPEKNCGTLKSRCFKQGHAVQCEQHPDSYHKPNKECVQCKADAKRQEQADKKKTK